MGGAEPVIKGQQAIIEVRDATVTFGMERGQSRVLDNVTVDILRDEVLGIVGESGSGKSMFASAILNAVVDPGRLSGEVIYYPDDGEPVDLVAADQEELNRIRWEHVSFLVQAAQSGFNPTMTIRNHFVETLQAHDWDKAEGMDRARELLTELRLNADQVLGSYPHELSGGMKQRALIALSLVLNPEVLIMDEPTAALDLLMQRSIINLLNNLKNEYDLTLLFITHDLSLVSDIADRLAVMYAFKIIELGPTEEILHNAAHPYTRALLKSVPTLSSPIDDMAPIEGKSPDPVNVPEGCSYHPRCPLSDEHCRQQEPELLLIRETDDGLHRAACFYWEDAAEAIPLERSRQ